MKACTTFRRSRLLEKLGYVSVFRIDAAKDRTHAPGHIRGGSTQMGGGAADGGNQACKKLINNHPTC